METNSCETLRALSNIFAVCFLFVSYVEYFNIHSITVFDFKRFKLQIMNTRSEWNVLFKSIQRQFVIMLKFCSIICGIHTHETSLITPYTLMQHVTSHSTASDMQGKRTEQWALSSCCDRQFNLITR